MSIPLDFLRSSKPSGDSSLGELLAERLEQSPHVRTLLDCLCSTHSPAIFSSDPTLPPLFHDDIHSFIRGFSMPLSSSHSPLGPNDRVMIALSTGPVNAVALLAIATYHTCAPVNASCTTAELKEDALRLRIKAIMTTEDSVQRLELRQLGEQIGCDVVILHDRDSGAPGLFDMTILNEGEVVYQVSPKPSVPHGLDDQSLILHTSGTSGKKKVVPYTLRSLLIGTMAVVVSWDLGPSDVNMNMMPLFHVGGIVRNLLSPMLSGGSTIMCPGFDAMMFWDIAFKLKSTWYYAAPTIHHAILVSQPEEILPSRDLKIRMVCNAAGGLLPSLAAALKERFEGAVILPSYGMTECMPIASPPTTYQLERPGCSGVACGPYLSIRDPKNIESELLSGKTGAVCVRGYPTFRGYEVSPDANVPLDSSALSSEGWFDTGDCGHVDSDGYLYITGRSKEIINKGGEVISPFEIEEAIITTAKGHVKATLAFSIAHDVLQEAIGVVIVPEPGRPRIGLPQLHDLLGEQLHPSKWPFVVVYMEELPKNSAGKPLRINLATRLGLECFTDNTVLLRRHFEAQVPSAQAPLSQAIDCLAVSVDFDAIEHELFNLEGVEDVAVRSRADGALEAFLFVKSQPGLDVESITRSLRNLLPGYSLPQIHLSPSPLLRNPDDAFAFDGMEPAALRHHHVQMSSQETIVRDIVAEILSIDVRIITPQSDFFLLGGNSLLLGKLSYIIRKKTKVTIPVAAIFTNRTISGIASLIEAKEVSWTLVSTIDEKAGTTNATNSGTDLTPDFIVDSFEANDAGRRTRGQHHPLVLLVQSIPMIFFYPLKSALRWTFLLFVISRMSLFRRGLFYEKMGVLLFAIVIARVATRVVAPLGAILFKWIVIGKYRPGTYRMWSGYYLRWWIVNQSILSAGKGIFASHPVLQTLYYRLLGARIGRNVSIDGHAQLGEFDLLSIGDGCRIDSATVRGFCVEREGTFRLEPITIGRDVSINTYTSISPGSVITDNTTWGPHSSSLEQPLSSSYDTCNRTFLPEPKWALKVFVAWPVIFLVNFASYIPWFAVIWLIIYRTDALNDDFNALLSVIYWFAAPQRVLFHIVARVVRKTVIPILQVCLGIAVKRLFGLNKECAAKDASQMSLLRRFINSRLLSKKRLKNAFDIVGTHYEVVSLTYRLMGAKVGQRVYWPGSGIYCLDPELLQVGDDVIFGSRSQFFTTDRLGTARIMIGNGAMIADRVVLLPGIRVGHRAVMGSGALSKRNAYYEDNSVWMGNHQGEAICFDNGFPDKGGDTITPFGRAFYKGEAEYFVFPYFLVILLNAAVTACYAGFWSLPGVTAAQILQQLQSHLPQLNFFTVGWYTFGVLYGLVAIIFVVVLNIQVMITLLWAIGTKWIVIGRRRPGQFHWDKSSYCQRWQLHLTLSRPLYKGYGKFGLLSPINGTAFIVWFYRAFGAKIGRDCAIFPSGRSGLITEPDLVEVGDNVSLDFCSVVAHLNSRGNFELNPLRIGNDCALRSGSRLLSGASMEDNTMLCEHTCLTSGEVADNGEVYVGWPARRVESVKQDTITERKTM